MGMSNLTANVMRRTHQLAQAGIRLRQTSTFEKVIVANSVIMLLDTAMGWWVTQHNPETYHYLIDTTFIATATVVGLFVNFLLLRAAFAPLHEVLNTIHQVEQGDWSARAELPQSNADALVLAGAFNAMLDQLARERFEASARVLQAQEEERRRLALELHDETGQSLTALALHAAAISQGLEHERGTAVARARDQATHLQALAERTLAEVQALARQLRPPLLDDLGLVAALRWLADDATERLHARVHLQDATQESSRRSEGPPRLSSAAETAFYRIAQESLTNAVRHGQASDVWITLRHTASCVTLLILDNGHGFERVGLDGNRQPRGPSRGTGLAGMRERARLVGGRMHLRAQPGHGCIVRAVVPVRAVAPDVVCTPDIPGQPCEVEVQP
jgi:two-component system sensor histidine kinase UhpB